MAHPVVDEQFGKTASRTGIASVGAKKAATKDGCCCDVFSAESGKHSRGL